MNSDTLRWIDRDSRRREREAAGLRRPMPVRDPGLTYWGGVFRYAAAVKPAGTAIPLGAVVIAVRRDERGACRALLVEAYEGDRAAFATFPRLAEMLGATELQLCCQDGTMLERIIAAGRLADVAHCDRAAILARPLAVGGRFDRSAIMSAAVAVAKARRAVTGETWSACLSAALKGAWKIARAARAAA